MNSNLAWLQWYTSMFRQSPLANYEPYCSTVKQISEVHNIYHYWNAYS